MSSSGLGLAASRRIPCEGARVKVLGGCFLGLAPQATCRRPFGPDYEIPSQRVSVYRPKSQVLIWRGGLGERGPTGRDP